MLLPQLDLFRAHPHPSPVSPRASGRGWGWSPGPPHPHCSELIFKFFFLAMLR
jgi:hypothetical protein